MSEITSRLSTALAGRYAIQKELGAGGMATVYLAEDLKHHRKVAVKVLRPELAAVLGAERFVQEIETTANLQHPHILPLFDSGEADGFLYYVMPFIEGETLREKLDRETQFGIDEAVRITTEIADALDYAHRHNVIHRDIKPENILLHDGRPMVADFGIALAVSAAAGGRMTETGMSLGTPHYMSPEQATADKDLTNRSDIYSLACVLYEMLTGEPPHTGASAQAIVMKIVTEAVQPVTDLRRSVPPHVAAAVAKALEKLAADRFESSAKFAEALANPAFTVPTAQQAAVPGAQSTGPWNRLSAALALFAVLMTVTALWGWFRPDPRLQLSRYSIALPAEEALQAVRGSRIAISPDGSRLVYVGPAAGGQRLWVRARDRLEAAPLPGTDDAIHPFVSPDGSRVGFYTVAPNRLKVASLGGGPPITVADTLVGVDGASWGTDGFLYYDGLTTGGTTGILRVPAGGGQSEQVTIVDTAQGETDHVWPEVLPNGNALLFTVMHGTRVDEADVAVRDLSEGSQRVLVRGVVAKYASSGHLLYVTADGTLMAAPFDDERLELTGDAVALVDGVGVRAFGSVDLTISTTGTLVYVTGAQATEPTELVWVDRDGGARPIDPGWVGDFRTVALSPGGSRLAVSIAPPQVGDEQLWVKQLPRGPLTKLTFDGTQNYRPAWTPDGRSVMFVSNRGSNNDLYVKRADGSAVATLVLDRERSVGEGFRSSGGQWLLYRLGPPPSRDLYALRSSAMDDDPVLLVATEFSEVMPRLSPDGRWMAYLSDESGDPEIYVRPFPNTADARWQVSTSGGAFPRWSHSGREIFYQSLAGEMMAVEIVPGETFAMGARRALFSISSFRQGINGYDVTGDDQRFVMIRFRDGGDDSRLVIVENFFEELKAKVGN